MYRSFLRFLILPIVFFVFDATAQSPLNFGLLKGKIYVSGSLEYLEIVSDTLIYSSINAYGDTSAFRVQNDTLFIKERYVELYKGKTSRIERERDYKVFSLSADTLRLQNPYRYNDKPFGWEDTLVFVNLEKLKEPTQNFSYFKMDAHSVWSGTTVISIDRAGFVSYTFDPIPYSINNPEADKDAKPLKIKGRMTSKELAKFKGLLSLSMPSKLAGDRPCAIDATVSNFEIKTGSKKNVSRGCEFKWVHYRLLNYLYSLDANKEIRKR